MEEILRNTQGNDSFFYVFMVVLIVLAIGSSVFKKNISLLFSNKYEASVENSYLFIFFGILLFSISGGLFMNSVFEKHEYNWPIEVTDYSLIHRLLTASIFCFSFLIFRFTLTLVTFFVLGIRPNIQFYFLLRSRYILFVSFILLTFGIIIKRLDFTSLQLNYLLIALFLIILIGFVFSIFKRLVFLIRRTDIPLYYIILYLCTLEFLPIGVIGKILIVSS